MATKLCTAITDAIGTLGAGETQTILDACQRHLDELQRQEDPRAQLAKKADGMWRTERKHLGGRSDASPRDQFIERSGKAWRVDE